MQNKCRALKFSDSVNSFVLTPFSLPKRLNLKKAVEIFVKSLFFSKYYSFVWMVTLQKFVHSLQSYHNLLH